MVDTYVLLAPLLVLAVVALFGFVGCDLIFELRDPTPPIAFVQVLLERAESTPVTSVAATFQGAVTPGNLLVVWIWFHSSNETIASVTDDAGNTYEPAQPLASGQGALATGRQQVFFAKNAKAGGGAPIAFNVAFTGPVEPSVGVDVFEYRDADRDAPFVVASQGANFGHDAQSPEVPLAGARLLFGAVMFSGEGLNDPAASLRLLQRGNIAEDYLSSQLPAQISALATNPDQQSWIAQLVAFK
jgi:hypothetical protein